MNYLRKKKSKTKTTLIVIKIENLKKIIIFKMIIMTTTKRCKLWIIIIKLVAIKMNIIR